MKIALRPEKVFPTHSHRDMEIINYILSGSLEHPTAWGSGSVDLLHPGDVQPNDSGHWSFAQRVQSFRERTGSSTPNLDHA